MTHTYITADSQNGARLAFSSFYRCLLRPWKVGWLAQAQAASSRVRIFDPHYTVLVSSREIISSWKTKEQIGFKLNLVLDQYFIYKKTVEQKKLEVERIWMRKNWAWVLFIGRGYRGAGWSSVVLKYCRERGGPATHQNNVPMFWGSLLIACIILFDDLFDVFPAK